MRPCAAGGTLLTVARSLAAYAGVTSGAWRAVVCSASHRSNHVTNVRAVARAAVCQCTVPGGRRGKRRGRVRGCGWWAVRDRTTRSGSRRARGRRGSARRGRGDRVRSPAALPAHRNGDDTRPRSAPRRTHKAPLFGVLSSSRKEARAAVGGNPPVPEAGGRRVDNRRASALPFSRPVAGLAGGLVH